MIVDFRTSDDAGVYRWDGGSALVQTVDFFTPIVDDPYTYGRIAAANSLSDVYAMGGQPRTALAVGGFPKEGVDTATIAAIFRGGFDVLREAGVALLGGHTVQDREIKFGYAVTGAVDVARLLSNAGARPGDVLFLTKPIGTGVVGTAIKFERAPAALVEQAVASMCTLNRAAAEALQTLPAGVAHACTDITGFGLIGHGIEMAAASGASIAVRASDVPVFDGVVDIARANRSGGMTSNEEHYSPLVRVEPGVDPDLVSLLYDPQTSGGLLIAVDGPRKDLARTALERAGVRAIEIGRVEAPRPDVKFLVRA